MHKFSIKFIPACLKNFETQSFLSKIVGLQKILHLSVQLFCCHAYVHLQLSIISAFSGFLSHKNFLV